ncbi:MAG: hypothetical protein JHC87_04695 [Thermoleophilaceae bacterium]|nr:hypothetical protein [Thermoleophilaceae bacterium]
MNDFTAVQIDDMEAIFGGGFKRARAALGLSSFGMAVIDLPPNFDKVPAHVHTFDGQEEIYLALAGSGFIEIGGTRVPVDTETIVRVGPGAVRRPIAGPDGIRLLSVGGIPGAQYKPFPNSMAGAPEIAVADLPGVQAAVDAESDNDYVAMKIAEMDNYKGAFFRVRSSLGITSFGVAVINLAPNSEHYPRHNETVSGQEEAYVVLGGAGEIEVDGEHIPVGVGSALRIGPAPMRKVLPGDEGMRFICIGGTPGQAYEVPDMGAIVRD